MEREVSEVDRKLFLKKTYLDKIDYFLTRNPINQEELYSLVRKFFGEYLKLDYEFTYEELSQELNKVFIKPKVKEHIDDFLIRLSESEYLEESTLGTNEINGFLKELMDVIQNIIYDDRPVQEEETLIEKVLKIKHKEQNKPVDASSIKTLIEELNFHISSGNVNIAKKTYVDVLKDYDMLRKEDKNRLHDDMNDVYEKLQVLIKNPKAQSVSSITQGISGQKGEQNVSDDTKKILDMIDETLFYINASNLVSAKKNYAKTLKAYESLNSEDKSILHPKVNELYDKLQALSVKSKGTAENKSAARNTGMDVSAIGELPVLEPLVLDNSMGNSDSSGIISIDMDTLSSPDISADTSPLASADESAETRTENIAIMSGNEGVLNVPSLAMGNDPTRSGSAQDAKRSSERAGFNVPIESTKGFEASSANFLFTAGQTTVGQADQASVEKNVIDKKSGLKTKENTSEPITTSLSRQTGSLAQPQSAQSIGQTSGQSSGISAPIITPDIQSTPTKSTITNSTLTIPALNSRSVTDTKPLLLSEQKIETKDTKTDLKIATSKPSIVIPVGTVTTSAGISSTVSPLSASTSTPIIASPVSAHISTSGPVLASGASSKPKISSKSSTDISPFTTDVMRPSTAEQSRIPTMQPIADSTIEKLNKLLRKINDDVLLEKLEKAKVTYKDALVLYRSMNDPDKAKCYQQFYTSFKKLDEALHQKSLSELLDKHLSEAENSHRPMAFEKDNHRLGDGSGGSVAKSNTEKIRDVGSDDSGNVNDSEYNKEFLQISKMTTLPVMLSNDSDTTRVYELVEESYFNMDNNHPDLAMHKYFKALELYHNLPMYDKKRLYSSLYDLFKNLSVIKRT